MMKLKALALVLLVFSAMFATSFAVVETHYLAIRQKAAVRYSFVPADGNGTVSPNEEIDTPGLPT
jgi:hypothetical protein